MLFDPHPKIFFKKEKRNFLLTQIDKRCEILKNYGVDYVIILKFSSSVAKMTPHYFCSKMLENLENSTNQLKPKQTNGNLLRN